MDNLPRRDNAGDLVDNIVASLNQQTSPRNENEWDDIVSSNYSSRHHQSPGGNNAAVTSPSSQARSKVSGPRSGSAGSDSTIKSVGMARSQTNAQGEGSASQSIFDPIQPVNATASSSSTVRANQSKSSASAVTFRFSDHSNNAPQTPRNRVVHAFQPSSNATTSIADAEKDMDDPTISSHSHAANDQNYHTPTSLTQLLGAHTVITPGASRNQSYNQGNANLLRRPGPIEGASLPDHLYTRGLLGGRHSDIAIIAYGNKYNLHRLILDRAPFFALAFQEPWQESSAKEIELHPQDVDPSITQNSFELALKRLYGCDISEEEDAEAVGLFATGCWLEMQELIDSAVSSILRQMCPENLAAIIKLVVNNYYGKAGDRILSSAKAMLCREGWDMPLRYWDAIPGSIVQEVVSSDGFFVVGEWERWNHARRLLDRKLKHQAIELGVVGNGARPKVKAPYTLMQELSRFNPYVQSDIHSTASRASNTSELDNWLAIYTNQDIESIFSLLDEGIHYIHLPFEQLQHIQKTTDIFGLPIVPPNVIMQALFMQMELRQKVMNAKESDLELGLSQPWEPKDNLDHSSQALGVEAKTKGKSRNSDQSPIRSSESSSMLKPSNRRHKFWIPNEDQTLVMGGNAEPMMTTNANPLRIASCHSAAADPPEIQWTSDIASSFSSRDFTAQPQTPDTPSAKSIAQGQGKPHCYSNFPPFRFSAEFPNPRLLKEKKRVYSRTVFYAGSFWNIYIQKMRGPKQNWQPGIYLHRAKERDVDESISGDGLGSSVDERIGVLERELLLGGQQRHSTPFRTGARTIRGQLATAATEAASRSSTTLNSSPETPRSSAASTRGLYSRRARDANMQSRFSDATMSTYMSFDTDSSDADSDSEITELADDSDVLTNAELSPQSTQRSHHAPYVPPRVLTIPTYTDTRPTVRTYFKIYSASKAGRLLSVFESAPDQFDHSQSWGWRSSTLMLDEGFNDDSKNEDDIVTKSKRTRAATLRFSVVIGNL